MPSFRLFRLRFLPGEIGVKCACVAVLPDPLDGSGPDDQSCVTLPDCPVPRRAIDAPVELAAEPGDERHGLLALHVPGRLMTDYNRPFLTSRGCLD